MKKNKKRKLDGRRLYAAYGLTIESELSLPELPRARPDTPTDITIRHGTVQRTHNEEESREECHAFAAPSRVYYHFDSLGTFEITEGKTIVVDLHEGADAAGVRTVIENLSMGIVLHQRGHLVLHGSAVSINGQAIALIGDKGWGKSTMAAALQRRGHVVLSDDVLAIQIHDHGAFVVPSFPQLKLWPDAIGVVLNTDTGNLQPVNKGTEKRVYRPPGVFPETPKKLSELYILGREENIKINNVESESAFRNITRHTYTMRILDKTGSGPRHLRQVAQLISKANVCRLGRPKDLSMLPTIADKIEKRLKDE